MKNNLYAIKFADRSMLSFRKDKKTGLVHMQLDSSETDCTVKECKEVLEKLRKCILE